MNDLRIGIYLVSKINPIIRIEVATSLDNGEELVLNKILNIIELSSYYRAKLYSPEEELKPKVDDYFPIGTACLLEFESHNDALKFINDFKPK